MKKLKAIGGNAGALISILAQGTRHVYRGFCSYWTVMMVIQQSPNTDLKRRQGILG